MLIAVPSRAKAADAALRYQRAPSAAPPDRARARLAVARGGSGGMLYGLAEELAHMDNNQTRIVNPQAAPRGRAPKAWLLVVHSQDAEQRGQRFPLAEEDVTIGREKDNTIVVPSESASRRHARVFVSGGSHVLVDLESTNGTLLNGKTVAEQTLRNGDVIRVGSTVLRYGIEEEAD